MRHSLSMEHLIYSIYIWTNTHKHKVTWMATASAYIVDANIWWAKTPSNETKSRSSLNTWPRLHKDTILRMEGWIEVDPSSGAFIQFRQFCRSSLAIEWCHTFVGATGHQLNIIINEGGKC